MRACETKQIIWSLQSICLSHLDQSLHLIFRRAAFFFTLAQRSVINLEPSHKERMPWVDFVIIYIHIKFNKYWIFFDMHKYELNSFKGLVTNYIYLGLFTLSLVTTIIGKNKYGNKQTSLFSKYEYPVRALHVLALEYTLLHVIHNFFSKNQSFSSHRPSNGKKICFS